VRPWPGALSPAFGTNTGKHESPQRGELVRPWPGASSPAFGTIREKGLPKLGGPFSMH
jgi:hypothetical protein